MCPRQPLGRGQRRRGRRAQAEFRSLPLSLPPFPRLADELGPHRFSLHKNRMNYPAPVSEGKAPSTVPGTQEVLRKS